MISRNKLTFCSIAGSTLLVLALFLSVPAFAASLPKGIIEISPPRPAQPLKLSNMDGKQTDLARLSGQWVMVHFWASWCGPCRRELPTLDRMAGELVPGVIQLVMVNTAEKEDDVFVFMGGVAPSLDTLLDTDGAVTNAWQPRGLPSTYFVDPKGQIRFVALGGRGWDTKPYKDFIRSLSSR
jgi:thiol-disulfide isomerase/thioredoxin